MAFPAPAHLAAIKDIDRGARAKKVSVLGTGVNPGYVMDALVLMLTAPCVSVNRVSVTRIVNAATRRLPLQRKVGVGLNLAQFRRALTEGSVRHVGLVESIHMIAAGLAGRSTRSTRRSSPRSRPRPRHGLPPRPRGAVAGSSRRRGATGTATWR
jgi:4-hydroxy-tetrahydrodipicolinate reductase